jgi:hypothetical protein
VLEICPEKKFTLKWRQVMIGLTGMQFLMMGYMGMDLSDNLLGCFPKLTILYFSVI